MGHLARKQTLPYRITYPRGSTFGPLCFSFPENCGGSGGRRPTDVPKRNRVMAKSRGKCSVTSSPVSSERNISVKPHVIYGRKEGHSRSAASFPKNLKLKNECDLILFKPETTET